MMLGISDQSDQLPDTVPPGTKVVAKDDFEQERADELNIKEGDIITVHEAPEGGWWRGTTGESETAEDSGWFPSTVVAMIRIKNLEEVPTPVKIGSHVIVKFPYSSNVRGELALLEGDVIIVTECAPGAVKWRGMIGIGEKVPRIGMFPAKNVVPFEAAHIEEPIIENNSQKSDQHLAIKKPWYKKLVKGPKSSEGRMRSVSVPQRMTDHTSHDSIQTEDGAPIILSLPRRSSTAPFDDIHHSSKCSILESVFIEPMSASPSRSASHLELFPTTQASQLAKNISITESPSDEYKINDAQSQEYSSIHANINISSIKSNLIEDPKPSTAEIESVTTAPVIDPASSASESDPVSKSESKSASIVPESHSASITPERELASIIPDSDPSSITSESDPASIISEGDVPSISLKINSNVEESILGNHLLSDRVPSRASLVGAPLKFTVASLNNLPRDIVPAQEQTESNMPSNRDCLSDIIGRGISVKDSTASMNIGENDQLENSQRASSLQPILVSPIDAEAAESKPETISTIQTSIVVVEEPVEGISSSFDTPYTPVDLDNNGIPTFSLRISLPSSPFASVNSESESSTPFDCPTSSESHFEFEIIDKKSSRIFVGLNDSATNETKNIDLDSKDLPEDESPRSRPPKLHEFPRVLSTSLADAVHAMDFGESQTNNKCTAEGEHEYDVLKSNHLLVNND
jgi:hypothetical protein